MDKIDFGTIEKSSGPVQSNISDVFCVYCQDRQFVHPVFNGEPDYSRVIPCPLCYNKRAKMQVEHTALGLSGIPLPKQNNTFATFKQNKANQAALSACIELATGRANFKIVLIYGGYGCGKTHLVYASCHKAIEGGMSARYYSISTLLTEIRSLMNNGNADDLINKICAVGFLALDDWGANKETDWSNSVIEQIIDYRYSHEKPLIVTTNKDIESIPPAVLSRFRDTGSRIVFNGDVDRRVAR